jgi:putative Mg2+ transporter-C (MgtC) family protein
VNGISDLKLIGRLVLAALLGFIIGFERERARQPAGQRTHALVALGAATFAITRQRPFGERIPIVT